MPSVASKKCFLSKLIRPSGRLCWPFESARSVGRSLGDSARQLESGNDSLSGLPFRVATDLRRLELGRKDIWLVGLAISWQMSLA